MAKKKGTAVISIAFFPKGLQNKPQKLQAYLSQLNVFDLFIRH
ncbi:protein of unknown function [Xenorhabdus poinarii G6]|uniref:Uncharacterized protein n=1 Tax=Xenorhabdus poinarii G6 TaxID=1354304 RepID=A0A068R3P3_9GAMM|nr:protein of unknown function [Xenorhabdus poinarii G6]